MLKERVSHSPLNRTPPQHFEMPLWTVQEICVVTGGRCDGDVDLAISRVFTDSRNIQEGDLFIPLHGPSFDGHDFVQDAFRAGAVAALVKKDFDNTMISDLSSGILIYVDDVMRALDDLAKASRQRAKAKIIAITGSYGKTSMKDTLAHALSSIASTHKTVRSFNNHWGLPLTLANLHQEYQYAVIEMGMNNAGEIRSHSLMAQPHIALITNTGDAHIGKLGSLENIANAKAEIFDGFVDEGAVAILYSENWATAQQKEMLKAQNVGVMTFGFEADYAVSTNLSESGLCVSVLEKETEITADVTLPVFAKHWGLNVAACAATLNALKLEWQEILPTLSSLSIPAGRGIIEQVTLHQNEQSNAGKITVIDDSYNAAPGSMKKALEALTSMKSASHRIIAVLGDMLELGDESQTYHMALKDIDCFSNIDLVYTSGSEMQALYEVLPESQKAYASNEPQDVADEIVKNIQAGDIILVKGSRGQWAARGRMAIVVDALKQLGQKD